MKSKFDYLPEILLEEIFKFVDPKELFEYRFISKYLFKIVNNAIRYNLTFSIYHQIDFSMFGEYIYRSSKYQNYQEIFIKENGSLIKHLNINEDNLDYLTYCPNIMSLSYYANDYNQYNSLGIQLPKLKKLIINLEANNLIQVFNLFSAYLNQIEVIEVYGFGEIFNSSVKYLNPDKIKSISIHSSKSLWIEGLDIVKAKFNKLTSLCLEAAGNIHTPTRFIPNLNFVSQVELKIKGNFNKCFDICCFGDPKEIKSIRLIDTGGSYFRIENYNNILIEKSNYVALGHFNLEYPVNFNLMQSSTLSEVYIEDITDDFLELISSLPNVKSVHFCSIKFTTGDIVEKHTSYGSYFIQKAYDENYVINENLPRCRSVKKITIAKFDGLFKKFVYLLSFFPNLKVIKVQDFLLRDLHEEINFRLITPVLLIMPIELHMNLKYYNKLKENIPMLSWMKL